MEYKLNNSLLQSETKESRMDAMFSALGHQETNFKAQPWHGFLVETWIDWENGMRVKNILCWSDCMTSNWHALADWYDYSYKHRGSHTGNLLSRCWHHFRSLWRQIKWSLLEEGHWALVFGVSCLRPFLFLSLLPTCSFLPHDSVPMGFCCLWTEPFETVSQK